MKPSSRHSFSALPPLAQLYVGAGIAAGASVFVVFAPRTFSQPGLLIALAIAACLTSMWKVNLPTSTASGSTLSVSYAADLSALILLGWRAAMIVAIAGVVAQCTLNVKQRYPWYRTVFSMSAEAITVALTGVAYTLMGGPQLPGELWLLPKALIGAIGTYFVANTALIAGAIALSTGQPFLRIWTDDFLWSAVSFFAAGSAGAAAAVVIDRGQGWIAVLMLAPIYLTYRTYRLFVARLEDQRRHLAEIEVARFSAEQANRIKDQFLAVVSHELRTPLNAILGWADLLRNGSLEPARRARATQAIFDSAKRQAQLVDELLDVSRIMSGKLQLERSMLDLRDILRAAIEIVSPSADAKRIQIFVEIDPDACDFFGDGQRLQQVTWNLLTNAIKFTPEGGSLQVQLGRTADMIELAVRDTGQGIPTAFLASVFEPFRQADGSSTRRHGGLGLGLSIVKHLVEAHGGTITASSHGEGSGSTFTVRLPAITGPSRHSLSVTPPAPRTDALALAPSSSLAGIRVLVVDDDDESREVVATFLEAHQAEVVTAGSAAQAMSLLSRRPVDVLLADIAMPGEDGYQMIRRIRSLTKPQVAGIPAAALTAFARDGDRQLALAAGFQQHLTKPIDARSLVGAVSELARLAHA